MKMVNHKVSILIPTYNRAKIVSETIESAINQTYENLEIIIVDNCSTDGTFEILKKFGSRFSNLRIYQNNKNLGPVRNWQRCIELATGEFSKLLFSDDLIDSTFIVKTIPFLLNNNEVGFVFTGTKIFDEKISLDSYFIGNSGLYKSTDFIWNSLVGGNLGQLPVSPGNALFRTRDLKKNLIINIPNKFGIDFKEHGMGNDLLIYLLTSINYRYFAFVNEGLSHFRNHSDILTLSLDTYQYNFNYNIARAFFLDKYFQDDKLKTMFNSILIDQFSMSLIIDRKKIILARNFYSNEKQFKYDKVFFLKIKFYRFRLFIINKVLKFFKPDKNLNI